VKLRNFLAFETQDNFYKSSLISIFFLLSVSIFLNFSVRSYEKSVWNENPSVFSSEGEPRIRSGDPAYFIKNAQYFKSQKTLNEYNKKMFFPSDSEDVSNTDIEVATAPPLSRIISYLAKDNSLTEIVKAGNRLVLAASVITAVGIFFLFYVIGRPYEGVIASLGGGISTEYFNRSSIGYIDTDILNLFFMYFLFSMVYLSSKNYSWLKSTILVAIAGLTAKIFYLWYPKPELILMSFFSLIFLTLFNTKNWKRVLVNSAIFVFLSNPQIYMNILNIFNNPYLKNYLSANVNSSDLIERSYLNFNNIFRYIGELESISLIELIKLEDSSFLGLICFIGMAIWAINYPIIFIGFAPLAFFFLLSIILGQRAYFYSIPFFWFGFGYFINFVFFKFIAFKKLLIKQNLINVFTSLILIAFAVHLTGGIKKPVNITIIQSSTSKALIKMNEIVKDREKSVLVAPWTYGYESIMYNDLPILIHPGMPTSPRHYFISRAYTAQDIEETSLILNYVAGGNVEKINEKGIDNFKKLSKDIYNQKKNDLDIYLMLTEQQRRWMNSHGSVAYWDIENNKPYYFGDLTAFDIFNIMEIDCDDLDTKTFTTTCYDNNSNEVPVNLALGLWDSKPILKRVVQVANGKVEINEEYKNSEGNFVFQIIKNLDTNESLLYLMHDVVFNSSYNQLFHLNKSENFELVYDDYPRAKIYKVN